MISYPASISGAVTGRGFLLVLSIVVPVAGTILAFAAGGRMSERIVAGTMPLSLGIAVAIMVAVGRSGSPLVYLLGGWPPPLGITLRADGLSVVMIAITAIVIFLRARSFAPLQVRRKPVHHLLSGFCFWPFGLPSMRCFWVVIYSRSMLRWSCSPLRRYR